QRGERCRRLTASAVRPVPRLTAGKPFPIWVGEPPRLVVSPKPPTLELRARRDGARVPAAESQALHRIRWGQTDDRQSVAHVAHVIAAATRGRRGRASGSSTRSRSSKLRAGREIGESGVRTAQRAN